MHLFPAPLLTTCLLTGAGLAQQASYTFFGALSGADFGQHLAVTGAPRLGSTFTVSVAYNPQPGGCGSSVTPYAAWLLCGFSRQSWAGMPLPAPLPQGFTLLVSPDFVLPQAVWSGTTCPPGWPHVSGPAFTVAVPNHAGLLGVRFFQQIVLARANTFGGLVAGGPIATDGGDVTLGT